MSTRCSCITVFRMNRDQIQKGVQGGWGWHQQGSGRASVGTAVLAERACGPSASGTPLGYSSGSRFRFALFQIAVEDLKLSYHKDIR